MQKITQLSYYLPLSVLAAMFGGMAVLGLVGAEEFYTILAVLNQSDTVTTLLVHSVFLLDGAVFLLLVFGNKLSTQFPWQYLFIWTGLWPWVPRVLEFKGGLEPEVGDAIVLSIAAALAYYFWKKRGTLFFKRVGIN